MVPAGDQLRKMGEIIARNMLSWLKLLIKLLLLHLVGCLYYCIDDARSRKRQTTWYVIVIGLVKINKQQGHWLSVFSLILHYLNASEVM